MKACIKTYDAAQEYFFAEGCFITELSNAADDPAVSIARARLEPGKTTRWHFLRDTAERYVVLQGMGSVEVGDLPPQGVPFLADPDRVLAKLRSERLLDEQDRLES